jgi:cell division cycle 14
MSPIIHPVLEDRLYVTQGVDTLPDGDAFRVFKPSDSVQYCSFCDDFGPMNMHSCAAFIKQLDKELLEHPTSRLFYCVDDGERNLTNAVFLLGAYMILKLDDTVESVCSHFDWIESEMVEAYRDATHNISDFDLSLQDCWEGLERGKEQGWIRCPDSDNEPWGEIDIDEYAHYDSPVNGDLHEVVPGKFIAFKGPHDLGGLQYQDDDQGCRSFSPSHYADIFNDFNVKAVIRLNEPEYQGQDFVEHGIKHYDLEFEDCTAPPSHIVAAFFAIVDGTQGAVAIHCKAGLGRTGTLIALYLMRSHGFTARQAIAWLRIMRPGSVIGEQQHYLCGVESPSSVDLLSRRLSSGAGPHDPREQAAQVAAGMLRRGSFRAAITPSHMEGGSVLAHGLEETADEES